MPLSRHSARSFTFEIKRAKSRPKVLTISYDEAGLISTEWLAENTPWAEAIYYLSGGWLGRASRLIEFGMSFSADELLAA
jgi:hypothetical protein